MTIAIYNQAELRTIRKYLTNASKRREIDNLKDSCVSEALITPDKIHEILKLFYDLDINLMLKIIKDKRFYRHSWAMFFPILEPRLVGEMEDVLVTTTSARSRGFLFRLETPEGRYVVKPVQSCEEEAIARKLGKLGIGPQQTSSIEGYLTEDIVEGKSVNEVMNDLTDLEAGYLARQIVELLSAMHREGILFNDTIISAGNLLVNGRSKLSFIDFGLSVDCSTYPKLTEEQSFRILANLPSAGLVFDLLKKQGSYAGLEELVRKLMHKLLSGNTLERILDLDFQILRDELSSIISREGGEAKTAKIMIREIDNV